MRPAYPDGRRSQPRIRRIQVLPDPGSTQNTVVEAHQEPSQQRVGINTPKARRSTILERNRSYLDPHSIGTSGSVTDAGQVTEMARCA
jgi:hypothetical protein